MLKLKYVRHPLQTMSAAKALFAARISMWRFAAHGERRFRGDPRYNLQYVTDGFLSRVDESEDDAELLKRICTAYIRTVAQQAFSPKEFSATEWWQEVQQRCLASVMRALLTRDVDALRGMYRNFFRDSCSAGLVTAPYGMSKAYFGGKIKDTHRQFYLSLVLHRFDYWMAQTGGRFSLRDLASPMVGNPFGVLIDGTHVRVGAEFAHYCAHRVDGFLGSEAGTVAEIGGGYGGMAYYLLRDRPRVTYLDFDTPESIALTSYYLMKSFPEKKFLLYGEEQVTRETIARADVVLMPVFEIPNVPDENVDITFSSHAMADLSAEAMVVYLNNIDRITRDGFIHIGNRQGSELISELMIRRGISFELAEKRSADWHSHVVFGAGVGISAGLAASEILEQCYLRMHNSYGFAQSSDRSARDEAMMFGDADSL